MNNYNLKEDLCLLVILIGVAIIAFMCGYDISQTKAKTKLVQDLCSKTEYDFCVKVQQKPVYTIVKK